MRYQIYESLKNKLYNQYSVLIKSIFNNRYYGQYMINYLFLLERDLSLMHYFYVLILTFWSNFFILMYI